ncbi:TPM domain-containing protein [Desulfonatronum parangueonense]
MPFSVRQDAPPWEGLLRTLGVIFVFMGVIWLFWKHNQRTIEMLDTRQVVMDQAGALTEEQKNSVVELSRALRVSFGLELRLLIATDALSMPVLDARTIYIALNPEQEQVVVVLPPIVERALGHGFTTYLRHEHFIPYWESGNWQRGLGDALGMIWDSLSNPGGVRFEPHGSGAQVGNYGSYRGSLKNEDEKE